MLCFSTFLIVNIYCGEQWALQARKNVGLIVESLFVFYSPQYFTENWLV